MDCRSCQHPNPDDARFCGLCGAPLVAATVCPACERENPAGQRFCHGCGRPLGDGAPAPDRPPRDYTPRHLAERILTSRSALEGERKRVTVLFADVSHSMELAERLDPEEWHRILERFFEILTEGVHRFEGTVNQYTGDGVMALFGAPIAHEDHAQRACFAALAMRGPLRQWTDELRRTRGLGCSVRMGINSGEVVVGRIGDDLRMDYTAQGHTVGLAQRMEQLAEPGTAYLTAETAGAVEGYFQLRALGGFTVKGVSAPVEVFELEGEGAHRTRLDVSRARGFSRFVGRAREMAQLEAALAEATEGHGRIVGVVADAGVGKSRLCFQFAERCRSQGIAVWEAHCPPHGRAVPMLPMVELARAFYGVGDHDPPGEARRRIAGTLILLGEEFRDDLPLAFEFARFPDPERPVPPMDPRSRRRKELDLLRRLLHARSAREPAVLLVDDLHWVDAQSDAFLADLVEVASPTRTLVLLNFRPEYEAAWMERSDYQQIPLRPLGQAECDELLRALLGAEASLDPLRADVSERSGGNPFFAEELVRALAESGAIEGERGAYRRGSSPAPVRLPETVHGVLAARIDRLAEREKRVLQAAAVVGREFAEPLLARASEVDGAELAAALDTLRRGEMVHETALYPVAEYAFRHPLTHQVALESQLAGRRAETHAAVARAIEALRQERLDEEAPLLAHHWEEAGDLPAAMTWHRRAAIAARGRDAPAALLHWRRVAELGARVPDDEASRTLRLEAYRHIPFSGWVAGLDDEEWRVLFDEGEALARRAGDRRTLAALLSGAAGMRGFAGEHRTQVEMLEEALDLARGDDFATEASLYQRLGWSWELAGDNLRALEWTERGIAFCATDPARAGAVSGFDTHAWLHAQRGWILAEMGRLEDAERSLDEAERLLAEHPDGWTQSYVRGCRRTIAWVRGDNEAMLRFASLYVEYARRTGNAVTGAIAHGSMGTARSAAGDWAGALGAYEQSRAVAAAMPGGFVGAWNAVTLVGIARAAERLGDASRARNTLAEVDAVIERSPELRRSLPDIVLVGCETRIHLDGAAARARVEPELEALLWQTRERGWGAWEPFALQQRANLRRLLGDGAGATRDLGEARRLFEAMGAPLRVAEIDRELAE